MLYRLIDWLNELGPRFYTAFIEADRWKLYLQGLGRTLRGLGAWPRPSLLLGGGPRGAELG